MHSPQLHLPYFFQYLVRKLLGRYRSPVRQQPLVRQSIWLPWRQDGGYDKARMWAMGIAERIVDALPDIATIERTKSRRARKVYVDVMQNVRGHHAVPPYVA
jgi:hypothetical protein